MELKVNIKKSDDIDYKRNEIIIFEALQLQLLWLLHRLKAEIYGV